MKTQVRLAGRQGLLQGKGLSRLQVAAIYYAEIEQQVEERERDADEFGNSLKYALLSSGTATMPQLFPEFMDEEEVKDDDVGDQGEASTYRFADLPPLTEDEMAASLQALLEDADGGMTVNGGDLHGDS